MLTNQDMKPGRYLRWAQARRKVALIRQHLEAGRTVQISNYLHAWRLKAKHAKMIKAGRTGVYMQRGKS